MSRRRQNYVEITSLVNKVEVIQNSVLKDLGDSLRKLLEPQSSGFFLKNSEDQQVLLEYVDKTVGLLPKEFDDRFFFDSYLIQTIASDWSQGPIKCSGMIVPTYSDRWGHKRLEVPSITTEAHNLHLIFIPQNSNTSIPYLNEYPWICHELGHYLLSRYSKTLTEKFLDYLSREITNLRRRAITDRGVAKVKGREVIDEVETFWNWKTSAWLIELAIDVISIWYCGPAYIAVFIDEHEQAGNPFQIEQSHPPIELRSAVINNAANRLGWHDATKPLRELQMTWSIPVDIQNRYSAFRNAELIKGVVDAAIAYCEYVRLPLLKPDQIEDIVLRAKTDISGLDGIEIIVGAWLMEQELDENSYQVWEKNLFDSIVAEVRQ